jgi:hypothetical protein
VGKMGMEIADLMGPPGSKSKSKAPVDEEDAAAGGGDEAAEGEDDTGDQEAAELSAYSELKDAITGGTEEEGLSAFKKLLDICG